MVDSEDRGRAVCTCGQKLRGTLFYGESKYKIKDMANGLGIPLQSEIVRNHPRSFSYESYQLKNRIFEKSHRR